MGRLIIKEQRGLTLAEMLLVLLILSVFLMAAPPLFLSVQKTITEKYFLQQFETDILFAQSLAVSTGRAIYYEYHSGKKIYTISDVYGNIYIERQLPEPVVMHHGHLTKFRFNGQGNINTFGNIWVHINGKVYRIYISIGSGRFEIFEENKNV
mgnify:FL=1